MRRFLLSLSLAVGAGGTAVAADIYSIPADPVPSHAIVHHVAAASWTGPYIGLHGGYLWGSARETEYPHPCCPNLETEYRDYKPAGWLAGLHAGFNAQHGSWVIGYEGDVSWVHGASDSVESGNPNNPNVRTLGIDWLSTHRLRVGHASGQTLIYGTGGLAIIGVDTFKAVGGDPKNESSEKVVRTGFAVGGGIEHMVTDNLTLRASISTSTLGIRRLACSTMVLPSLTRTSPASA